jgi:hypothetical protein
MDLFSGYDAPRRGRRGSARIQAGAISDVDAAAALPYAAIAATFAASLPSAFRNAVASVNSAGAVALRKRTDAADAAVATEAARYGLDNDAPWRARAELALDRIQQMAAGSSAAAYDTLENDNYYDGGGDDDGDGGAARRREQRRRQRAGKTSATLRLLRAGARHALHGPLAASRHLRDVAADQPGLRCAGCTLPHAERRVHVAATYDGAAGASMLCGACDRERHTRLRAATRHVLVRLGAGIAADGAAGAAHNAGIARSLGANEFVRTDAYAKPRLDDGDIEEGEVARPPWRRASRVALACRSAGAPLAPPLRRVQRSSRCPSRPARPARAAASTRASTSTTPPSRPPCPCQTCGTVRGCGTARRAAR